MGKEVGVLLGVLVLFNEHLVSEGTFGAKYDSYTHIKLFITSITITYYHHFCYHVLTFISITNLLYFLIPVYFFEDRKNMGIITRVVTNSRITGIGLVCIKTRFEL